MKILRDWGFTLEGWRNGQRGEYWVLWQGILIVSFAVLPPYRLGWFMPESRELLYSIAGIAAGLVLVGAILFFKGFLDLGRNLTPLPYPRDDGHLVQSGVYSFVRHPVYSGLIFAALGWAIALLSLSHLVGTAVLLVFFNAKASREEAWLTQRYPDYSYYRQRVKKLVPWVY